MGWRTLAVTLLLFVIGGGHSHSHANSMSGAWGALRETPRAGRGSLAIHASVLPPTTKVWMAFSKEKVGTWAWVWDTVTDTIVDASIPYDYDMMCGGTNLDPNGCIFMSGGRINANRTATFCADTMAYTPGPLMYTPLYYPSNVLKGDGKSLVFFGRYSGIFEYDPAQSAEYLARLPASTNLQSVSQQLYPRVHLLPTGDVFLAGIDRQTQRLNLSTATWSPAGLMVNQRFDSSSVILPGDGCHIMVGGGDVAITGPSAEIIDACAPNPRWEPVSARMQYPRSNFNFVILPDGKILVVGGKGVGSTKIEMFDPISKAFALMADMSIDRGYHSTAWLNWDGTVTSAGGADGTGDRSTLQTFKPPYLFGGPRPIIIVSSSQYVHGGTMSLTSPDAASIARVTMIAAGTSSHGVNFQQKHHELTFTKNANTLDVVLPSNPNAAPPGWYMLWAINAQGVPSLSSWIQIKLSVGPPPECVVTHPTVSVSPSQLISDAGTLVSYTVSVRNNDSAVCAPSHFDLSGSAPSGWQADLVTGGLTIGPGAALTTVLRVASPSPMQPGMHPIQVDVTRGAQVTVATAAYGIALEQAGPVNTEFFDDFDASELAAWSVAQGSVFVDAMELRNRATPGLHIGVVPSIRGTAQHVEASFMSTYQSNGIQTFGLVLRYQNPMNYYKLYREAGGSSALKIAAVVNGVTTILGSLSIPNPTVNTWFGLTAVADGQSLSIAQGTRTLRASHARFDSGSVGVVMGSTSANPAVSHKVEDFYAVISP